MITPQNPTYAYVGAFVDELARAGVRDVVICPGSRSTPLTLTFAAEERIRKWVLVDERSAAFFALGIAKQSGSPVALVCTSGTAAANFFPAVCEAKASRIPLIVMTADRPPELQEVGAPQTMGQKYLYGEHVKWFSEMPLPESTDTLLRYARFTASRAVATTMMIPHGPIHLNFPFREPLTNNAMLGHPLPEVSTRNKTLFEGRKSGYTYIDTEIFTSLDLSYSTVGFSSLERGLIIVGNENSNFSLADYYSIFDLALYMKYPVLVDPRSQMRFLPSNAKPLGYDQVCIENYDVFLRDADFIQKAKPEFVIRIGTMPISKPLLTYLQSNPDCKIWIVDNGRGWLDPTLSAEKIIHADISTVLSGFKGGLEGLEVPKREKSDWLSLWQDVSNKTRTVIRHEMQKFEDLFEGRVFTEIESLLPMPSRLSSDTQLNLVVGNSMPIRDCETFFPLTPKKIRIFANRGVNGIDGQISTALGIASLNTEGQIRWQGPTVLVVGDLTFYHDLNGLLAAKKYGLNLTVVVINNDGGGIFSFLPQAEHHPDHFEEYFGTPTGLNFSLVTEMYGGTFTRIQNWEEFRAAVTTGITEGGLHIVEVPTNRESNVAMHRHLWKKVSEALTAVDSD